MATLTSIVTRRWLPRRQRAGSSVPAGSVWWGNSLAVARSVSATRIGTHVRQDGHTREMQAGLRSYSCAGSLEMTIGSRWLVVRDRVRRLRSWLTVCTSRS
ncbi:hypothetical protein SMICM17S_13252 [Streptomyces microflavus]